jgi:hypothetical protein
LRPNKPFFCPHGGGGFMVGLHTRADLDQISDTVAQGAYSVA